MTKLSESLRHPSSFPNSVSHPDQYALSKAVSEYSEDVDSFDNIGTRQLDGDISTRSSVVQGAYVGISLMFLLAGLVACMNHDLFVHLDGEEPGSCTDQFWVTVLKNAFPAAVSFLLFLNLKTCLLQVALHLIQRNSHPLETLNLITSPPSFLNTISVLFNASSCTSILGFALLTAITQVITLTSLLIPGTLSVVPSPPRTQKIGVPTIDFNFVDPAQSVIRMSHSHARVASIRPSQRWDQLIRQAASRNYAPRWDPPVGCGSACSYTFSYSAPALNCTHSSKDEIWPSGMNTTDSRLAFGPTLYTFYNASHLAPYKVDGLPPVYSLDFEVVFMDNVNSSLEVTDLLISGNINPQQWSPTGAHCTFQNATYEAETTFSNNTQSSSTRVAEWIGPMSFMFYGTNTAIASCSIASTFDGLLMGMASYIPKKAWINSTTEAMSTALFNLTSYPPTGDNPDTEFTSLSLPTALKGDLSAGLHGLFGNITLAFVNERMATTNVEARVTPNSTQYQYIQWRLGLIYGVVFCFSFVVIAFGLFCLRKNGMVATFDLQHIMEMTAESTHLQKSATRPNFGSAMIRGVFLDLDGMQHRRMALEAGE